MIGHTITFSNTFAEHIGPLLIAIRATGFFEAGIFIPTMTAASVLMFIVLLRGQRPRSPVGWIPERLWLVACYALCFLATNVTAIGFKTLIVEELDYATPVWFASLVGPLHFYILSVVLAYLVLIFRKTNARLTALLCIYVQAGLIGGYAVGAYRIFNEPITLFDLTAGISGFINIVWFGLYNADVATRFMNAIGGGDVQPTIVAKA
ncbi:MAG: hypothetical protein AAF664_18495 [Planctomycetota bacterium]